MMFMGCRSALCSSVGAGGKNFYCIFETHGFAVYMTCHPLRRDQHDVQEEFVKDRAPHACNECTSVIRVSRLPGEVAFSTNLAEE